MTSAARVCLPLFKRILELVQDRFCQFSPVLSGGAARASLSRDDGERRRKMQEDSRLQDSRNRIQIVGTGATSEKEALRLADERAEPNWPLGSWMQLNILSTSLRAAAIVKKR